MEQIQDELFPFQILSSSNCAYILIRNPASILSFYSVSDEYIIHKWTVNNNSIWSIYPSLFGEIKLSNQGCLAWSTGSKSVFQFCSNPQTTLLAVQSSQLHTYELSTILTQQIIWLPTLLCIIGAFSILFCLIIYKILFDKQYLKNNRKQLNFMDELPSNDMHDSSDADSCSIQSNISIENIQNEQYITNTDMDGNDDIISDEEKNNFIDIVTIDLRGKHQISQDYIVGCNIITPDISQLTEETSDLCVDPHLITLHPQLRDIISQEEMVYDYNQNSEK